MSKEKKNLQEIIEKYLPELPEAIKLIKEKFSSPVTSKTFKTDGGELTYDGELATGIDVFMDVDKKTPAPTKTYKHEDGTEIVVEAGKVVDVKKPVVPAKQEMTSAQIAEELFKAFPKTDLSAIEVALGELKKTLSEISTQKNELAAKVAKFEGFKDEVIGILEKFSKSPSEKPAASKKTDSSKSIFSMDMSFEDKIKRLQSEQK